MCMRVLPVYMQELHVHGHSSQGSWKGQIPWELQTMMSHCVIPEI